MDITERISARLAELVQAKREAETRLVAIRTVIAELQALLGPAITTSDNGEQGAAGED